ncbi:MAG: hypothetical protein QXY37_04080 [Metallosphaera sp.]
MRRIGPDVDLLAWLTGESKNDIIKLLKSISNLSFTPIPRNKALRIYFQTSSHTSYYFRKSLKDNFFILISERGVPVLRFENYSGNPLAYNVESDSWDLSLDSKFEPELFEFQYEGETEPLPFSRFSDVKSFSEIHRASLNCGNLQGFIIDYGRRDFVLDVVTPYQYVKENLELLPFIRYSMTLSGHEGHAYLMEFSIPERHVKEVMEVMHDVRDHVSLLVGTISRDYTRPFI